MALTPGHYFWVVLQATNARIVQWAKSWGNVALLLLMIGTPYLATFLAAVLEGNLAISTSAISTATNWALLVIIAVCILVLFIQFFVASYQYANDQQRVIERVADTERAERRGVLREMIAAAREDVRTHFWHNAVFNAPYRRVRPYLSSELIEQLESNVHPGHELQEHIRKRRKILFLDALTELEISEGLIQEPRH